MLFSTLRCWAGAPCKGWRAEPGWAGGGGRGSGRPGAGCPQSRVAALLVVLRPPLPRRPCPAALTSSRPRLPECHSIPASLTVCLAHQDVSSRGTGMLVPCHRGTLGTFDLAWCQQTLTNQSGMRKCTRSS